MEKTEYRPPADLLREVAAAVQAAPSARAAGQAVAGHLGQTLAVEAVAISLDEPAELIITCREAQPSPALTGAARHRPWRDAHDSCPLQAPLDPAAGKAETLPLPADLSRQLVAEGFKQVGIFPLRDGAHLLGALTLFGRRLTPWSADELRLVEQAADALVPAAVRARLESELAAVRAQAERDRQRLTFLARAGEMLSYSLDLNTTLRRLARLVVPVIADWCAVDLVRADGSVERVAVSHAEPARVELAYDLHQRFPPPPDAESGVPAVSRTGEPEFYPEITDEMLLATIADGEQLALLRELSLCSMIIAPLKARFGRDPLVLGTLTLAMAESARHFDEDDLALAVELGRRAALAVDNARLYGEATRLNEELEERVAQRTRALRASNRQLLRQMEEVRQAEDSMRQNETLYRLIAHHIPNGSVLVVDRELRYRLADGPSLRESNYGPLEGLTPWDILPQELADRRATAYRAALEGASLTTQMTVDDRVYRQQTVPLPGRDGTIEAALVLTQDITDLKVAEDTAHRLLHLSEKLHGTLDIEQLLDTLTEEAIRLTGASGGFSGLTTAAGLITRHYLHEGVRYQVRKRWQPGEGIPGRVQRTKEPYLTNNTLADEEKSDFADRFDVRSLICTPVLNRDGDVLGFFEVTNKSGGKPFTEEDRDKLMAVSRIAAIGIENAQSYAQLRHFSQEIVRAQEAERRRLSRELHDSAGQLLTALKLHLSLVATAQEDAGLQAQLEEAVSLADEAHEEIRATSQALRPPALEMVGLDETLRSLCQDFGKQVSLPIGYEGRPVPRLPDEVGISFYRFLQEALTNVARHAQASSVRVQLAAVEEQITLSVADDGVGMAAPHRLYSSGAGSGVGLLGLRERFELIGGRVEVYSRLGHGTRLVAHYPLPREEEE